MGFDFVIAMHTVAMFLHYFFNLLCLVALLWLIKDKPFEHWRDQYTREMRITTVVSTVYSFKATRVLYSGFLSKPYFDAVCENRFRTLLRPFFLITMASVLGTGVILIANVYTIWLLRWGYEIVTLSISSIVMNLVIFGLEVYEFILYRDKEPLFMGVNDYFKSQMDPEDRRRLEDRQKQKESIRRTQIKVMGAIEDGGDLGIPEESAADLYDVVNESQKQLIAGKVANSEQAPAEAFRFENLSLGRQVKVNRSRIDFGEQDQAETLQQMIRQLDEHEKIRRIRADLDSMADKKMAAYDGTDIPHSDDEGSAA